MKSIFTCLFVIFMSACFSTVSTAQMTADASANRDKDLESSVTTKALPTCKVQFSSSVKSEWRVNGGTKIEALQYYEGTTLSGNNPCPFPKIQDGYMIVISIRDGYGTLILSKAYNSDSRIPPTFYYPNNGSVKATLCKILPTTTIYFEPSNSGVNSNN